MEATLTAAIRSKRADVEGAKTAMQASSSRGAVLKALMEEKVCASSLACCLVAVFALRPSLADCLAFTDMHDIVLAQPARCSCHFFESVRKLSRCLFLVRLCQ